MKIMKYFVHEVLKPHGRWRMEKVNITNVQKQTCNEKKQHNIFHANDINTFCHSCLMTSNMDLEKMKSIIEELPKHHQIEILKIIKDSSSTINENKSGIYVNMSFLPKVTIQEMNRYIKYVQDQEQALIPLESQKDGFKNSFFAENVQVFTQFSNL